MDTLKPADKVTAVCIGIVILAAVFCFFLCRHLKIEYPVPDQSDISCHLRADADYEDDEDGLLFRISYTGCKAGNRRMIDVSFREAPWLLFTDEKPGTSMKAFDPEEDPEDVGYEVYSESDRQQLAFYAKGNLYFYPDIEDKRFADFMKSKETLRLTTAHVTYDDGTEKDVEIGRILLSPAEEAEEKTQNGREEQ